jgi:glycerol kinase
MQKEYILAVDQSTSGTKALIIDRTARIIARSSLEHKQYYPQAGWVEHDPVEIYDNVKSVMKKVLQTAQLNPTQIALLTITNQRETALVWDRTTGLPIHNAIVWQCRRTSDMCAEYKEQQYEPMVQSKTGLLLDPYFSATKIKWILDNADGARAKLNEGRLLAGTIDSWLVWKLTGGKVHATDYTNASRTSLFNIHTLQWDEELLKLFDIPPEMLPEVKSSNDLFGHTEDPDLFGASLPISGIIGDSQGALFGQLCFKPGMAKATYGTGTSVLMNIGDKPVDSDNGLVTAIAWGYNGQVSYALEAIIHTSGDCIKWVRDNLGLFQHFDEIEQLATSVKDNDGVYLVPAFVGLGAPYWDPYARAAIIGLSRGSGKAHIVRAALESIAYQIRDAVELMEQESGITLEELKADGGATGNQFLMQFQSDILHAKVVKSAVPELSAMGSVYLGGLGIQFWSTPAEIAELQEINQTYTPAMQQQESEKYYQGWKNAVVRVLSKEN